MQPRAAARQYDCSRTNQFLPSANCSHSDGQSVTPYDQDLSWLCRLRPLRLVGTAPTTGSIFTAPFLLSPLLSFVPSEPLQYPPQSSIETAKMVKKIGNIYFIAAISIIGGGLFGFDVSSMSAIITTQPYLCYFQQGPMATSGKCTGPSSSVQGGITASMSAGSWLAALCSGFISDRFGRKTSIQIGSIIW